MKKFLAMVKGMFCSHSFQTIHVYDSDTIKALCTKCGKKYVINKKHNWKFTLDGTAEKDYDELRRNVNRFQKEYFDKQIDNPEEG